MALAPLVEGYHLETSNASTASSSDPSHTGGTVQSISTHSGGSTATDRTESSSSFIHVSHPVEEIAPAMTRAPHPPQTPDSASGSTVTPQTRPNHPPEHPHPEPTPLPSAPFLSASYLDGDSAETGITSLDPAIWWIGAHGVTGEEQRAELAKGIQTIGGLSRASPERRSIAETRVSERSTCQENFADLHWHPRQALQILLAYHHHALGHHREALAVLASVDWTSAMDSGWALGLGYQQLDLIRGKCLQGECFVCKPCSG